MSPGTIRTLTCLQTGQAVQSYLLEQTRRIKYLLTTASAMNSDMLQTALDIAATTMLETE
eukprot:m.221342 g.221342  ORF g.221342 m.221342 type:complete len:60 (-) comp15925_c0_seq12:1018-1197(-)